MGLALVQMGFLAGTPITGASGQGHMLTAVFCTDTAVISESETSSSAGRSEEKNKNMYKEEDDELY